MAKFSKSGSGPSQRQLRVGELIRHELADIFSRQKIQDDVLETHVITVTEVRVSHDLRNAVAFILPLGGEGSLKVVKAARSHIPYIRGLLAKSLNLKHVPLLNFEKDTAYENSSHIDQVLSDPHVLQDLHNDKASDTETETKTETKTD